MLVVGVAADVFAATAEDLDRQHTRVGQERSAMAEFKVASHAGWVGQ